MKRLQTCALAIALLGLSGCGGSGSSSSTPLPNINPAALPANSATASFTIAIPQGPKKPTSVARNAKYITSFVQGIDFSTFQSNGQGAGYVFYPLTPQSTYCVNAPPNLVCTVQVSAPPGSDRFVVQTYDSPTGNGNITSTGSVTQTINALAPNFVNITTLPVPCGNNTPPVMTRIALIIPSGTLVVPISGSANLAATFSDCDGVPIAGAFDAPIALALTSSPPHYSLSKTTWNGGADTVSIISDATGGPANLILTFNSGSQQQQWNWGDPLATISFSVSNIAPTPTPSPSPAPTPTPSPSPSPSPSPVITPTPSPSPTL